MSAGIKRMLAERRELARRQQAQKEHKRLRRVMAAFGEGARAGDAWNDPVEAWRGSKAYRRFHPIPRKPGDAIRLLQHERRLRDDPAFADRTRRLEQEACDAFMEGHHVGACGLNPAEVWSYSVTRKSLYPGPASGPHQRALMIAKGWGFDPLRAAGGPTWKRAEPRGPALPAPEERRR